jgi:hypothetical protein
MIDFDARCVCTSLFNELDLFNDAWPNAVVEVGMGTISITYSDRKTAESAADMLLHRLRGFTWFVEKH